MHTWRDMGCWCVISLPRIFGVMVTTIFCTNSITRSTYKHSHFVLVIAIKLSDDFLPHSVSKPSVRHLMLSLFICYTALVPFFTIRYIKYIGFLVTSQERRGIFLTLLLCPHTKLTADSSMHCTRIL